MGIVGEYLGMTLALSEVDRENRAYFEWCAKHDYHLQACRSCRLIRYPPGAGCPWCGSREADWVPVDARGAVYSYTRVPHAIQPEFGPFTPYLVLLVELDTQRGVPTADEALRVIANLATPDGDLAGPDRVGQVGIGTRVRMVFKDVAPGLALPLWTIDEDAVQPTSPWQPLS